MSPRPVACELPLETGVRLDADAAIDHLTGEPGVAALIATLAKTDLALASTTLVELYTGVYRSAECELRAFLQTVTILPLTRRVIQRAARVRADLLNQNLSVRARAYDILAGSFALEHALIIVTSNTRDYRGMTGLTQLDSRTGQTITHQRAVSSNIILLSYHAPKKLIARGRFSPRDAA